MVNAIRIFPGTRGRTDPVQGGGVHERTLEDETPNPERSLSSVQACGSPDR
ncbi:hypothetical protein FKM82_011449 [Ascaphus truei]